MAKITNVRKDEETNNILAVKLDDGREMPIYDAIQLASRGEIERVNVGTARDGTATLRSYPDGDSSNNLANLPKF